VGVVETIVKKMTGQKTGRLNIKWQFDANDVILAPAAISHINNEPHIIFGTKNGKIYVLNEIAKPIWTFDATKQLDELSSFFEDDATNSISAAPLVTDINDDKKPEILFGTSSGVVYALDTDGKPIWTFNTKGAIQGTPELLTTKKEHLIIICSSDHNIYALNTKGKKVWQYDAGSEILSPPTLYENDSIHILAGTEDGRLLSLSEKGELNWSFRTEDKITAQATVLRSKEGNFIIFGSHDGTLYAVSDTGSLIWKFKTDGPIMSQATIADINHDKRFEILFGSCDNKVYVLDYQGRKLWSFETDFWVAAPVMVADIDKDGNSEIIVGSYDKNVYILDSKGTYELDYIPGISGVTQQAGHYTEVMTVEPGEMYGKKLWQYRTEGVVVGCSVLNNQIIVCTDKGIILNLVHEE